MHIDSQSFLVLLLADRMLACGASMLACFLTLEALAIFSYSQWYHHEQNMHFTMTSFAQGRTS